MAISELFDLLKLDIERVNSLLGKKVDFLAATFHSL